MTMILEVVWWSDDEFPLRGYRENNFFQSWKLQWVENRAELCFGPLLLCCSWVKQSQSSYVKLNISSYSNWKQFHFKQEVKQGFASKRNSTKTHYLKITDIPHLNLRVTNKLRKQRLAYSALLKLNSNIDSIWITFFWEYKICARAFLSFLLIFQAATCWRIIKCLLNFFLPVSLPLSLSFCPLWTAWPAEVTKMMSNWLFDSLWLQEMCVR